MFTTKLLLLDWSPVFPSVGVSARRNRMTPSRASSKWVVKSVEIAPTCSCPESQTRYRHSYT